jgi:hypothetical protein
LVGCVSPNESRPADKQGEQPQDEPIDENLARLRGIDHVNEELHKLLSWAARKDYPVFVGIGLPIRDWVGPESHEIQFWEDVIDPIMTANPATDLYLWLCQRLSERASLRGGNLPWGMPTKFEGLSARAFRDGHAGYVLYERLDDMASSITDQPLQVRIGYEAGYTFLGMGEGYTLRTSAMEFWALTRNDWDLYPRFARERLLNGTICHDTMTDGAAFHNAAEVDVAVEIPVRILEEGGRGTSINSTSDQPMLLKYWAWARQSLAAGISVVIDNHTVEFWLNLTLDPLPDDEDPTTYPQALQVLWLRRLYELYRQIAVNCASIGQNCSHKMRYIGNSLKVWFAPTAFVQAGWKPLSESSIPKDKWITNEAFALTYPPMSDEHARGSADLLFGGRLQERYNDPEVQGGKIALIVTNNQLVQRPPNSLDRMTSTNQKQVAYNQRVLKAKDEIAGINSDVVDFLSEMSTDLAEPVIICVNSGASMKRNEAAIGGQFWQQGDRKMTAVNGVLEGMSNTRESAILTAVVEAVEWKRALELPDCHQPGQRVIIYPSDQAELNHMLSGQETQISEPADRNCAGRSEI